jgi:hypothetical protein
MNKIVLRLLAAAACAALALPGYAQVYKSRRPGEARSKANDGQVDPSEKLQQGIASADIARAFALDEQDLLNETAKALYEEAIKRLDRVDHVGALESLDRASQAQPGHVPLAFLLADSAKIVARREFGDSSQKYYRMALGAVDRVIRRPDLDLSTLHRAEQSKKLLENELQSVTERDERRHLVGIAVNLEVANLLGLEPTVVLGQPRESVTGDPREPFNVRSMGGVAGTAAPVGVGLGAPVPAAAAPAAPSPFGSGAPSPFGAAPSPFGAAPGGGSPFGAAPGGGSPFGAAPATGSPFGAAPSGDAAASPFGSSTSANPFGGS